MMANAKLHALKPNDRLWVIVPAAGIGSRMQADRPKQYLPLGQGCVADYTLSLLHQALPDSQILVPLHHQDQWWPTLDCATAHWLETLPGGQERAHSVRNALETLTGRAQDNDWVLVHDIARPCVSVDDIHHLIATLAQHPVGGLLAAPVADTMKRAQGDQQVTETVSRDGLWHALTPQMFRYGLLKQALNQAEASHQTITDEASAIEALGLIPRLVTGSRFNLKITHPEDLTLAEYILASRSQQALKEQQASAPSPIDS